MPASQELGRENIASGFALAALLAVSLWAFAPALGAYYYLDDFAFVAIARYTDHPLAYYLSQHFPGGFLVTTVADSFLNWARKSSVWPVTFGLACCAIEMMATGASRFDMDRFGAGIFRPSPRQSDLMIVAGSVTEKMAPIIRRLYEQMPEPKWVISMGACATSTGVFSNYALVPVNQVIPVDVYVPGCPPRPEQLIYAIMLLQKKIEQEKNVTAKVLNLA